jgi:hypothetical protein
MVGKWDIKSGKFDELSSHKDCRIVNYYHTQQ